MATRRDREEGSPGGASEVVADIDAVLHEYGSHASYMARVQPDADLRVAEVAAALRSAFSRFIRIEECEIIDFEVQNATELAEALLTYPVVLKSLLAICNIAGRAIERDLDLKNVDTYGLRLTRDQANQIAGFVKAFLPPSVSIAALAQIDKNAFFDKEIRAFKGQWEKLVNQSLSMLSGLLFKKCKFSVDGQDFELDSAYLRDGVPLYGVDVKRIEARRDIHKRIDEIVNKAAKLKKAFPDAKFGAVIYFPFTVDHGNIRDRLTSPDIDSIQFASESVESIDRAARHMLGKFGAAVRDDAADAGTL